MTMPRSRDLGSLLREQAARFGTHPALIGCGDTIGYSTLAERAARIAGFLAARGVQRGESRHARHHRGIPLRDR
jgi:acyl-CoA synthetase (AMP-forming)/AMP-acid ligase II